MRYLITGGAGFLGSHLADRLADNTNRVAVIDNLSSGKKENINPSAKFYQYDISDPRIAEVFKKEKPDAVFHFAAHIEARQSVKNPISDADINILGGLNILENCKKFKVKKVIFASSGGEIYGDAKVIPTPEDYPSAPISPYGVAKLAFEKYLYSYKKMYGINFMAMRYGNVYGPRQNPKGESGVIAIFAGKMLKKEPVLIHGDGKQTKDYIFIDDVVKVTMNASKKNINGIFNIATAKETSVLEIFDKLKKIIDPKAKAKYASFPPCGFMRGALSINKAKKNLNFEPKYGLDEGLKLTVNWFLKNEK